MPETSRGGLPSPTPALPGEPAWVSRAGELVEQGAQLLRALPEPARKHFDEACAQFRSEAWTVLVSGLRSVGKSSFVCALWGDSSLLPTAVCDCTQSNTVVRVPHPGETDRSLVLDYLPRERAQEFATRGLAYYRVEQVLDETLGPTGPRLDEGSSEEKLHKAIAAVKNLFANRRDLAVLYEPITEQVEQLEEFLAFLDSTEYRPDQRVAAAWDQRQEFLMGKRRADGRTIDVGKLLALRAVEVIRESTGWPVTPPQLLDTPWIPKFHNARRSELIVEKALEADVVVVVALPELLEPEEWLLSVLETRPDIGRRTLVVFNQIDTIDVLSLFRRDGFAEQFQTNLERLERIGIPAENLHISCARLPFLKGGPQNLEVTERLSRLEKALNDVCKAAGNRLDSPLRPRLIEAAGGNDGGLDALRCRLAGLYQTIIVPKRARAALAALTTLNAAELPAAIREPLASLQHQAAGCAPLGGP